MRPSNDNTEDLDTPEGRQERRKKDAISSLVSGGTNVPQLIEGLYTGDFLRLGTAGSAVTAYFTRSGRYARAYYERTKDRKDSPGYFSKQMPGDLMIGRGIGQTLLGLSFFQYGVLPGTTLAIAGALQTHAACVMRDADKPGKPEESKNPEIPKPAG